MKLLCFLLVRQVFSLSKNYPKNKGNVSIINGVHLDLLNLLQEIHKFNENGTFLEDADIFPSFQNSNLSSNLSYLTTTYKLRTFFIFRNPNQKSLGFDLISTPFKSELWLAVVLISLIMTLVLRISLWREENLVENRWNSSIYATISVLYCQQESSWAPKSLTSKIIFTIILLASVLIFNYYTSIMLALLLNFTPPVYQTIDEFNQSPLEKGLSDCDWSKKLNFPELDRNYMNFSKLDFHRSSVALDKVNSGGFAYYGDFGTIYSIVGAKFNQNSLCELNELKILPDIPVAFTVAKNSPLKEIFQISLVRLREVGITRRIHKKWEPPKPDCYSYNKWIPLSFQDVSIGFYCLFVGLVGGFLGFLVEFGWSH